MHRASRLSPLRFLAGSSSQSTPSKIRRTGSGIDDRVGCSSSVTTLTGKDLIGYQDGSSTILFQMQIVDALRSGERHRASSLLEKLMQGNYSLKANDFLNILNYCACSPDPLFIMETYKAMSEREIGLDSKSLFFIIKSLCDGGYLDQALRFISFAIENGSVSPVLPVCNYFLGACAKSRSLWHASKLLDLMDQEKVGKDECTYKELLKFAYFQHNLSAVQELLKEYTKHYSMSIFHLREFILCFSKLGDWKSAYELLQLMVDLALEGKHYVERITSGKLCSSRLDIPKPSTGEIGLHKDGFHEHPVGMVVDSYRNNTLKCQLSDIQSKEVKCSAVDLREGCKSTLVLKIMTDSFSDVINACGRVRHSKLADQLMMQMQNLGLQPSSYTYNGLIKAVVFLEGYKSGMSLLKLMQQQNLKPSDETLAILSSHCSKALQLDLAECLLDQVSELTCIHPFNHLLAACDTLGQLERACRVLAKMKQLKLQPDIKTYKLLFSLFGNMSAPYKANDLLSQVLLAKRIKTIEMDMSRNGVEHSYVSIKNLLTAFGVAGMVKEMIQHMQKAEKLFSRRDIYLDTRIYNIVLSSLVKAKESKMAILLFRNMKSCGFPLKRATYTIMMDCCCYIRCYKSALALVSLMIRDGFLPNKFCYTLLMKVMNNCKNFEESLYLLDHAASEKIELDVMSYNTILRRAFEMRLINVTEHIVERMHREMVRPDPTTCRYVFDSYVEQGFHSTALEALNVLSLRMLDENEYEKLQDNITEVENFIFSEDDKTESKVLFNEVHLAAMFLNLRRCATLGFSILWSEDQSSWARRLSTMYGTHC